MRESLKKFLETEITHQEYYDGIIRFILSGNIRCGEYECNEFVVKKMDLFNFIVFDEYLIDNKREIHTSFSVSKSKLINAVNQYAKKQEFIMRSFEWANN
ncbi:hypothetical protein [Jeotgalibacillus campisalis]|uniref:Uncharacterized protein n=1 Tax=Jeotgalibacillus campisalis TaxID=220754 RepID=A0A0C2RN80_9BACL|nr:hypothetical protein [Jeotgalibacillus campisalis]KIL43239.1 hypothetical protein KR50_36420 [Jeotgalibacillus campisalis]